MRRCHWLSLSADVAAYISVAVAVAGNLVNTKQRLEHDFSSIIHFQAYIPERTSRHGKMSVGDHRAEATSAKRLYESTAWLSSSRLRLQTTPPWVFKQKT